jgi:hypothetical protein
MNVDLPFYVTAVFVLTTLLTIGFLFYSFRGIRPPGIPSNIAAFLLPFWLIVTAFFAINGTYAQFGTFPPKVFLLGVFPAIATILVYFLFFRRSFIERLSLRALTWLHIVRIPVEFVLLWLFQYGLVPQIMTFEGRGFDILSGLSAPIVALLAFRGGKTNRVLLIVWNLIALGLLVNIVIIALLSFPSPIQRFGFEQPNVGVAYFPFIWLPAIIVPVVLFAHLAALWKLFRGQTS